MRLTRAAISSVPIDPDLANLHWRLGGSDDLQQIAHRVYLTAAVDYVEGATRRSMVSRQHVGSFYRFPFGSNPLHLPGGKCSAVESIVYYQNGQPITLRGPSSSTPGTDWQEDLTNDMGGILKPIKGDSWPSTDREMINPAQVTYTAGYAPGELPAELQLAIMVYAADRIDAPAGADVTGDSMLVDTLLSPWRILSA